MRLGEKGVGYFDLLNTGGEVTIEPAQQVGRKLKGGQGFEDR